MTETKKILCENCGKEVVQRTALNGSGVKYLTHADKEVFDDCRDSNIKLSKLREGKNK